MKNKANLSQGMLLFRLTAHQTFAIGTLKVREIVSFSRLSELPKAHPSVLGVTTIRGVTIPVIDMAGAIGYRSLDKEEMRKCQIVITDCQRKEIGFLVRGVEKIVQCNWNEIMPPSENLGKKAFLTGVIKLEDRLIQVLDVELLLSLIFPQDPAASAVILTDIQREKLKPHRILLVDDSLVARKQLSDVLDRLNVPYEVTDNGQKALDIMTQAASDLKPVDILVSDIEMPGLDGYELTFEVRSNQATAGAYIILHTSISSKISVSQAQQVGANEALTKFVATELVQSMMRGVEFKQQSS
jgi:two-component system chemotaxis response regulator CheV